MSKDIFTDVLSDEWFDEKISELDAMRDEFFQYLDNGELSIMQYAKVSDVITSHQSILKELRRKLVEAGELK